MKVDIRRELVDKIDELAKASSEKNGMTIERWVLIEHALENYIQESTDGRRITFNFKPE